MLTNLALYTTKILAVLPAPLRQAQDRPEKREAHLEGYFYGLCGSRRPLRGLLTTNGLHIKFFVVYRETFDLKNLGFCGYGQNTLSRASFYL